MYILTAIITNINKYIHIFQGENTQGVLRMRIWTIFYSVNCQMGGPRKPAFKVSNLIQKGTGRSTTYSIEWKWPKLCMKDLLNLLNKKMGICQLIRPQWEIERRRIHLYNQPQEGLLCKVQDNTCRPYNRCLDLYQSAYYTWFQ